MYNELKNGNVPYVLPRIIPRQDMSVNKTDLQMQEYSKKVGEHK